MTPQFIATAVLLLMLVAIALIDIKTLRIPNALNAALLLAGLAAAQVLGRPLVDAAIGAITGYAALFAISVGYRALRGRDGLGLGDAKLLGAAGAWLGWMGLPFVVLIGASFGLVFVAAMRLAGREISGAQQLAFGPFLCVGVAFVWVVQTFAQR